MTFKPEELTAVPVPALVSADVFALAQAKLEGTKRRASTVLP